MPRDRGIDRINYCGHWEILVSLHQGLISKSCLLEILCVGMPGRQVSGFGCRWDIKTVVGETMCLAHCVHLVRLSCLCLRKQRDRGTGKFHLLTHILTREDEQLRGCRDLGWVGGQKQPRSLSVKYQQEKQRALLGEPVEGRETKDIPSELIVKPSLTPFLSPSVSSTDTVCTSPGCTASVSE